MKVTLVRQVTHAEDRSLDAVYEMNVDLVLPPLPGTSVEILGRTFQIMTYKQVVRGSVLVYLEKDNETFKGGNFEKQCQKMVDLGFTLRSGK